MKNFHKINPLTGADESAPIDFDDIPASAKDLSFVYTQVDISNEWNITHNLGKIPSITVIDDYGNVNFPGSIEYLNLNQVRLTFNYAISGKCYLN